MPFLCELQQCWQQSRAHGVLQAAKPEDQLVECANLIITQWGRGCLLEGLEFAGFQPGLVQTLAVQRTFGQRGLQFELDNFFGLLSSCASRGNAVPVM